MSSAAREGSQFGTHSSALAIQAHDQQVARSPATINDPILERRLDLEAKFFEGRPRAGLFRRHHCGHFLESQVLAESEDLADEAFAKPPFPIISTDLNSNLADPPRPS